VARILVVDDEPHIIKLVSFTLEKRGHDVLTAPDAPTGIELATAESPDLIFMDVMMPGMTGLEALDHLKQEPSTGDIPVVMLSAKSQSYEQEEGLRRGALRYVTKPFAPADLTGVVSDILDIQDQ
jgi:CheY-like chemotaxis protein